VTRMIRGIQTTAIAPTLVALSLLLQPAQAQQPSVSLPGDLLQNTADIGANFDDICRVAAIAGACAAITSCAGLPVCDTQTKTVFLTTEEFTGDLVAEAGSPPFEVPCAGVTDGIAAADCICQTLADQADLTGTYKAWIAASDDATSPAARFIFLNAPFAERGQTTPIADSWADLTDGSISSPLDTWENGSGSPSVVGVWTNVEPQGQSAGPDNCHAWQSDSSSDRAVIGVIPISSEILSQDSSVSV